MMLRHRCEYAPNLAPRSSPAWRRSRSRNGSFQWKSGLVLVGLGGLVIGGLGISSFGGRQSIGHLLFLTAACLWACYAVAIRRWSASARTRGARNTLPNPSGAPMRTVPMIVRPSLLAAVFAKT